MTHYTYLLFNLLVIIVPLLCSLMPPFRSFMRWKATIAAILPMAGIFLLWDAAVIGKHWWFHPSYITGITLARLPIEEILFFFSVPFACLFVWKVLNHFARGTRHPHNQPLPLWGVVVLSLCTEILFLCGKSYTGLVVVAWIALLILHRVLSYPLRSSSILTPFIFFVLVSTFIWNGFLTALPITIYDPSYQLGIHIWTLPIEDFVYGLVLIMGTVMLFEYQVQSKQLVRRPHIYATTLHSRH